MAMIVSKTFKTVSLTLLVDRMTCGFPLQTMPVATSLCDSNAAKGR